MDSTIEDEALGDVWCGLRGLSLQQNGNYFGVGVSVDEQRQQQVDACVDSGLHGGSSINRSSNHSTSIDVGIDGEILDAVHSAFGVSDVAGVLDETTLNLYHPQQQQFLSPRHHTVRSNSSGSSPSEAERAMSAPLDMHNLFEHRSRKPVGERVSGSLPASVNQLRQNDGPRAFDTSLQPPMLQDAATLSQARAWEISPLPAPASACDPSLSAAMITPGATSVHAVAATNIPSAASSLSSSSSRYSFAQRGGDAAAKGEVYRGSDRRGSEWDHVLQHALDANRQLGNSSNHPSVHTGNQILVQELAVAGGGPLLRSAVHPQQPLGNDHPPAIIGRPPPLSSVSSFGSPDFPTLRRWHAGIERDGNFVNEDSGPYVVDGSFPRTRAVHRGHSRSRSDAGVLHRTPHRRSKSNADTDFMRNQQVTGRSRASTVSGVTSPTAVKSFLNDLRLASKESFQSAFAFVEENLPLLPVDVHWKVFLNLAACARLDNFHQSAHFFFEAAATLRPDREKVWVEYAKAEDQAGNILSSRALLLRGLDKCHGISQEIVKKAVRLEERLGNFANARALLGTATSAATSGNVADVAKIIQEGAGFEARAGKIDVARCAYRFLVDEMKAQAPTTQQLAAVFYEWACLEEKWDEVNRAIDIAVEGLDAYNKYNPLWFLLIRLREKQAIVALRTHYSLLFAEERSESSDSDVSMLSSSIQDTISTLSVETDPKKDIIPLVENDCNGLSMFAPGTLRACLDLSLVHTTVTRALAAVPRDMQFKIYFEAAQVEERAFRFDEARKFFVRSIESLMDPETHTETAAAANNLWKIWLGGARMELQAGQPEAARQLLLRARLCVPPKRLGIVLMEASRIHEFLGELDLARRAGANALNACRDWKVYLALAQLEVRAQRSDLARDVCALALEEFPGAGRLWSLLISLNGAVGGPELQLQTFRHALQEVPKSGEVWCEAARICAAKRDWVHARKFLDFAMHFTPQYGDIVIEYLRVELTAVQTEEARLEAIARLELMCVNSDPNYGTLWLQCKQSPLDSAFVIFRTAYKLLCEYDPRVASPSRENSDYISTAGLFQAVFGAEPIKT